MTFDLPMDQDTELQVIGGMVSDPSMVMPVLDVVNENDFAYASIRAIFRAIKVVSSAGRDVDATSVRMQLGADKVATDRLLDAMGVVTHPKHAVRHAQTVHQLAGLRALAGLGQTMVDDAVAPAAIFADAMAAAEKGMFDLSRNGNRDQVDWATATDDALTRLEFRYSTDQVVTGLPTGLASIDNRLTGLHPGWLMFIGGRPGEGKTALALQIALHASELGKRAMFVSLEMSTVELASRAICARAGLSYTRIRRSTLNSEDWKRFADAQIELADLPLDIFDVGVLTVSQMMSKVRYLKPEILVVDYVGLIRPDRFHPRKDIELAEISAGLKQIARECQIPVVACVQLNRNSEKREDKALHLSDLRDSGALEQDADVVYLLQRKEEDPNHVDAKCAKFRHGPTGTDKLRWYSDITRFADAVS